MKEERFSQSNSLPKTKIEMEAARFKVNERVQIRSTDGPSKAFEGQTGTIIAIVRYDGFCDYWVRIDLGRNVQFSERELALLGN